MSAQLRNNMAEILLSQGRAHEAETLFLFGAEQLSRVGDRDLLPHLIAGAAEAALNRGDQPLAENRIGQALDATKASSDGLAELAARRVAGVTGRDVPRNGHAVDQHTDRGDEVFVDRLLPIVDARRVDTDQDEIVAGWNLGNNGAPQCPFGIRLALTATPRRP